MKVINFSPTEAMQAICRFPASLVSKYFPKALNEDTSTGDTKSVFH